MEEEELIRFEGVKEEEKRVEQNIKKAEKIGEEDITLITDEEIELKLAEMN